MKFVRSGAQASNELSDETLSLGDAMELVHFSQWDKEHEDGKRACWAEALDPGDVLKLIDGDRNSSVLQSPPEDFESDVRAWVKMRQDPAAYFTHPLQCLLPKGERFQEHKFNSIDQKESIREAVQAYAGENGNGACKEAVHALFEELFMNATLDAPRENGREGDIGEVSVYLGIDANRMGIAFRDNHGSLKLAKLLNRMREVYERGAGESINLHGPGGAGLGCVIMLEKSSLICFGVKPGKVTMVTCLVPRYWSQRKRAEMKKSLHLILTHTD